MRRREYVHTYISDIQTIHKHAKSISNTKIPSAHHVPHNPFLHPVSNILNTQNLFFRTPGVHVGTTSAPALARGSVDRTSPAPASRTLERAHTARPPCLPFSPPLCPPRRPPRYASLPRRRAPVARGSIRARIHGASEPRANLARVDRGRATRARHPSPRARSKEIHIRVHRVVSRASTTRARVHARIHPSIRRG